MKRQSGIQLVHKPVGATSHSLVRAAQEQLHLPGASRWPICHGGTLDPFAEGLVLLLLGAATRLFDHLHDAPKTYVAEIAWGQQTDNGDPTGRVIAEGDPTTLTPELIEAAAVPLLGWTDQIPPSTSAKKVGGEPAYRKVHRGEEVTLPPSRVYLHSLRWLDHALPSTSTVELVCRGGYYVRAFARDLGQALGATAHLRALRRTAIGPWSDPPEGEAPFIIGPQALPWVRRRPLTDQEVGALRKGEAIRNAPLLPPHSPLPDGFPAPPLVAGIHREKLSMLLRPGEDALSVQTELRGGV